MPAVEQHQPSDRPAAPQQTAPGFYSTLNETWGPGAVKPLEQQPSNALDGFNQFCIGFGAGLGNFAIETTKAAGQAITHPGATVHNAVDGAGKALHAAGEAAVAGSSYIANKVSHGDVAGMTNDAVHTGQAIGNGIAQSVDHFNHLSAKEKGYIVGHDVAPTVIGTIIAPELVPEGATAAAFGKAASVVGTVLNEESVVAKVATTFESARERMAAISVKLETMSKNMEKLTHGDRDLVREVKEIGPRLRNGEVARGIPVSESFKLEIAAAHETLTPEEASVLKHVNSKKAVAVHNMAEALDEKNVFAQGTWKIGDNTIRIPEFTGYVGDLVPNNDVRHSLVHEIAHALDDKLGLNGPLSQSNAEFRTAYAMDVARNSKATQLAIASMDLNTPAERWAEVWADSLAHASDAALKLGSNSDYCNRLKEGFPTCIEFMVRNKKDFYL